MVCHKHATVDFFTTIHVLKWKFMHKILSNKASDDEGSDIWV